MLYRLGCLYNIKRSLGRIAAFLIHLKYYRTDVLLFCIFFIFAQTKTL